MYWSKESRRTGQGSVPGEQEDGGKGRRITEPGGTGTGPVEAGLLGHG